LIEIEAPKSPKSGGWCRTRVCRVMRMRLKTNDREESPTRLLQQLQRIHQQTVRTADGQVLHGLTEMTPTQKSLFAVLQLPIPTPAELSQPVL